MLDSVLRRGRTLDSAAQGERRLSQSDHALAIAIAGEVLRRLPDLDSLIDSATRQRLPDDSKARMVLRIALAQKIGLGTPEHALVATALPLVDGGPRRLVHGVLGTLLRRGLPESGFDLENFERCEYPACVLAGHVVPSLPVHEAVNE